MDEIKLTSNRKQFEVFFPKGCNLDKITKVVIREKEFISIVRCKDCTFNSDIVGNPWCRRFRKMTSDDWFCGDGKEKNNAAD